MCDEGRKEGQGRGGKQVMEGEKWRREDRIG